MMALLFSIYSLAIGYLAGADKIKLGILGIVIMAAILFTYYKRARGLLIVIFADVIILSLELRSTNLMDWATLSYLVFLAVPMLIALEQTLNGARGIDAPKVKGRKMARYLAPLAYISLLTLSFAILSHIGIYEIYFIGEGQTSMQILLMIGLGALFFMPFYEKYSLHKR